MKKIELHINNPSGLISKKAADLVSVANKFKSDITLTTPRGDSADLKSIMNVFDTLVNFDEILIITIEGPDEDSALEAYKKLIETNVF